MKIVAFVPIKLKSRRLKNKMRLPLGDKMLFQHIFDKLLNVKQDIDIYCYCSDNSIEKDLPSSVKFLQRDTYLDGDEIKGIQIYESFINDVDGDIYLLCHATSPFLKSKTIEIGLNKVIEKGYDVKEVQVPCGSTSIHGDRLLCDKCLNDKKLQKQLHNYLSELDRRRSTSYPELFPVVYDAIHSDS